MQMSERVERRVRRAEGIPPILFGRSIGIIDFIIASSMNGLITRRILTLPMDCECAYNPIPIECGMLANGRGVERLSFYRRRKSDVTRFAFRARGTRPWRPGFDRLC